MKKILIGLLIVVSLLGAAYFYFVYLTPVNKIKSINAVPSNAAIIIDLDDPLKQWEKLTSNKIWEHLKTNSYLSSWGYRIDSLNAEINKNETLWELVASRPVLISIHEVRNNSYDHLYIIDLQKASKFNFVKNYIDKLVGDDVEISTRDYHGSEIIEIEYPDTYSSVYLNFNQNLLIVSTTHSLIEQSIDQGEEPVIARDLNFIDVSRNMDDDVPTIYFQHQFFSKHLQQWFKNTDNGAFDIVNSIVYSGVDFNLQDDHFSLNGYSNIIDSTNAFVNVLHKSGNGKTNLAEIIPENGSFFMSLGFDDAIQFYENLEESIGASTDGDYYFENKNKLEKFLKIDIKKHFLSWVDDEVGVIQLHSNNNALAAEYAVAIKYNNVDDAKNNLNFIKGQIKKKTPVKFKEIDYKGHEISFLSIKGFFKVMFGNAFSKVDKPYYTVIGNYVVFSNQPATLGKIINSYIDGLTLSKNSSFQRYFERFDNESALFLYVNPEQLIIDSKAVLDNESYNMIQSNKDYIECFPMIGVQLNPKRELLTTEFVIEYMNKQEISTWNNVFIPQPNLIDSLFQFQSDNEESITVNDILPDDLNDKSMKLEYENGQIKFEVALKDGLKNGAYQEYDSVGNVIIKGRYKNDLKSGVWKYFDSEGNVLKKEKY